MPVITKSYSRAMVRLILAMREQQRSDHNREAKANRDKFIYETF